MHSLRSHIVSRRHLALMLIVLALAMKAMLPAGYMVSSASKVLTVTLCSETNGGTAQIAIPMKADGDHQDGSKAAHDQAGAHCPFSSLSMAATGGADSVLLAAAIAFILLLGLIPAPSLPFQQARYLLPPLRGPPAKA